MPKKPLSYEAALDFIMRRELFGIKLGLDNISRFLSRIGNPQDSFRSIHIAGTNGKGSTAAFLESVLRQAGYKTGIFTSPHLADYRERIRVGNKQISRDYIADFVNNYKYLLSRNKITFFETCTALAFCYLADQKVDVGIIEVGLGGRLDATNTLLPVLSIITDISYDHTNILGNTLKKIAFEKAGIVKKNRPVVTGVLKPEARDEILRISCLRNAPYYSLKASDFNRNGTPNLFDFKQKNYSLKRLKVSLPGDHQIKNAALTIKAVNILNNTGFRINKDDIRRGLKSTKWDGRFQVVKERGRPTIILDVGHNPAGVKAMVTCFRELFPGKKADLIVGFVRNKNLRESVGYLKPISRRVEALLLNTHRSADPQEIKRYFGINREVTISVSVINSLRKLLDLSSPDDIIIICGSHYAVGEFLARKQFI